MNRLLASILKLQDALKCKPSAKEEMELRAELEGLLIEYKKYLKSLSE